MNFLKQCMQLGAKGILGYRGGAGDPIHATSLYIKAAPLYSLSKPDHNVPRVPAWIGFVSSFMLINVVARKIEVQFRGSGLLCNRCRMQGVLDAVASMFGLVRQMRHLHIH